MLARFRRWVTGLKAEVLALWFSYRHSGTPLAAKVVAALVVAYALSPIDLVPDFIPILGYVDDALLLPLGIWLAIRLIPPPVLDECRAQAARWIAARGSTPSGRYAAAAIIVLWAVLLWLAWRWLAPLVGQP